MKYPMRQAVRYSPAFKENILAKVLTPNIPHVKELTKEFNISYITGVGRVKSAIKKVIRLHYALQDNQQK